MWKKAIGMFASFACLVLAIVAFSMSSFGWFSRNEKINTTNQGVNTKATFVSVTVDENCHNENIVACKDFISDIRFPGDNVELTLHFTCTSSIDSHITDFGIKMPLATDEIPITVEDVEYYLGTEIYFHLIKINGEDCKEDYEPIPLLRLEEGKPVLENISLYNNDGKGFTLRGTNSHSDLPSEISFTFLVYFKNRVTSQNHYFDFSENGGVCRRILYYNLGDKFN